MRSEDGLGVELHTKRRRITVTQGHDLALIGARHDLQNIRQWVLDDQGVVARGLKRRWNAPH